MLLCLVISWISGNLEQVIMNSSYILINGYIVIVQDYEHVCLAGTGIVQAFEGKTSSEGAISDHRDRLIREAELFCRLGKTEGRRH